MTKYQKEALRELKNAIKVADLWKKSTCPPPNNLSEEIGIAARKVAHEFTTKELE